MADSEACMLTSVETFDYVTVEVIGADDWKADYVRTFQIIGWILRILIKFVVKIRLEVNGNLATYYNFEVVTDSRDFVKIEGTNFLAF